MKEVTVVSLDLGLIEDALDHEAVTPALGAPTGFFDGWIKFDVTIGAIQKLDLFWKLTGRSNYWRSCFVDVNTTDDAPPSYVEADGATIVDGVWHQFKLYDPANPMPLPLFKGNDTITFLVVYKTGSDGVQEATAEIEFRWQEERT